MRPDADPAQVDGDRTPATAPHANRWQARPVPAVALRAASTVVPLLAGALVARALAGAGSTLPGGRAAAVLLGVGAALAGRRAARPFVALASLLRLGLVFPGPAPRRAALALQRPRTVVRRARTSRTGTAADSAAALVALLAVVGAHDRRHRHHTRRVLALCALLADRLALPAADRDRLAWAALLHDVGVLAVDDEILDKAGRPTPAQWQVLRRHPDDGARLAAPLLPWLGPWGAAVRHHHERWDGTGYPEGLAGAAIPLAARVVGLADAYESMTAARPYRAPLATRAARAEVVRCRGTQFDPDVVDALLAVPVPRLLRATGLVSLLANLPMLGTLAMVGRQGVAAAAVPQAAAVAASTAVVLGGVAATGGLVAPAPGGSTVAGAGAGTTQHPGTTPAPPRTATATTVPTSVPTTVPTTAPTTAPVPSTTRPGTTTTSRRGDPGGTQHSTADADEPTRTRTPPTTRPSTSTTRPTTGPTTRPTTRPTTTRTTTAPPGTTTTTRTATTGTTTTRTTTRSPGPTMTSTTGTAHPSETSGTPDPYADAPTTMLPAMRVPSQGPVAPRIRQAPPGTTTLPAAGFSWAPVAGLGYEAKLDDAAWRPCDGEWYAIFIDLPAGPHHFYVRSVDRTSGARSDAARYDWVVG